MKIVFSTLVFTIIFVTLLDSACISDSEKCNVQCSKDCCTKYCRDGICINFGESSDDGVGRNPCIRKWCPRGQECVLQQVQCFRAPCPPITQCVNSTNPPCHV